MATASILVVDDNEDLCSNLKDILGEKGYDVAVATSGRAAIEVCSGKTFDLALVDLNLPDMPGIQVIDRLAELSPTTEFVIITGHASLESAVTAARSPKVVSYETKPLSMDHLLALLRQVVSRRTAETDVREREEKYRAIFDEARDGIVLTDAETGLISDCNREFERQTGRALAELREIHIWDLRPPEQVEAARRKFLEIRVAGTGASSELGFLRPDGQQTPVEFVATKVDIGGRPYLQSVSRDVTERRKIEDQLRHSRTLASLGEMTAGIAHEVSNPLAAILLYSELVSKADATPGIRRDIKVIRGEAKRASNILKDLLAYSRKAEPITRRMDLHRTIRKVIGMRRYQEQVRNIDVAVHEVDGPLLVRGNAAQLTQLFMNIIVNAEEALENSSDKSIVVSTEADAEWARISIADSGPGIPEDQLGQVFVPFFSTKPIGKGTGLGLAACHGIVTAHGGLIRAENNRIGGATFIVELPLAVARHWGSLFPGLPNQ